MEQNTPANKTTDNHMENGLAFRIFQGIGAFSVRWRWLIIVFWIVVTVLAVKFLPSLSSVTQSDNSAFLPSSAPSQQAINLSTAAFGKSTSSQPIQVALATTDKSSLTPDDQVAIVGLQNKLESVANVSKVQNVGASADGQADQLIVTVNNLSSNDPTTTITAVNSVQGALQSYKLPSNLEAHLAGGLADQVDNSNKSNNNNKEIQFGSIIFIIVLLLIIFRAPLAPIITLIPPLLIVALSGPIIAEAANHGLKVSSLAQLLLTVLILGAGTDYALFLIFRVREELQTHESSKEAIIKAMGRVGESITFSAATVVAALLSLLFATFQIYSNLGIPLAIGIVLMLFAGLTLLPALLAVFGRAVFWPAKYHQPVGRVGLWGRVSSAVVRQPMLVLIVGLVVFGGLAIASVNYRSGGFGGDVSAPTNSDAAKGDAILAAHYPSSSSNPTEILFTLPGSAWTNPAPLVSIQNKLDTSAQFKSITGPLNPNGVTITPSQLVTLYRTLGAPQRLSPKTISAGIDGVPLSTVQAYSSLGNYVSSNGKTVTYLAGLTAGDPSSTAAINATPAIRNQVTDIANQAGATNSGVLGESPVFYDISSISNSDLIRIIPIAIVVIGILLGLLMRSLVAPLYLILSVALSYLAAFGITVIIFINIAGESGLTFILPFLMFIFLLALGEDYNILVMTRIREEAHNLPLKEAVSKALTTTGTTVTSAGLVLAGTFAVFAIIAGGNSSEVRDVGTALSIGILMDTFLVRTLLVPSIVVLLGKWNWWPSKHGSWVED